MMVAKCCNAYASFYAELGYWCELHSPIFILPSFLLFYQLSLFTLFLQDNKFSNHLDPWATNFVLGSGYRYAPGVESWSTSKLLGEHVGGSAVRSICFVSKMHMMPSDMTNLSDWRNNQSAFAEDRANPFLLISVGAKRVLTSWLLRNRMQEKKRNPLIGREKDKNENGDIPCINDSSSMSFKWLSTDMPTKNSSTHWKTKSIDKIRGMTENVVIMKKDVKSLSHLQDKGETESESLLDDKVEDDWRYLAVTSFLVKCTGSR